MSSSEEVHTLGSTKEDQPNPRFGWLAAFQGVVIVAAVLMARAARSVVSGPELEEQLAVVSDPSSAAATGGPAGWGGLGWLVVLIATVGAVLLVLPIAWTYVATRSRQKLDRSVVQTIILLPIAVSAILVIVQDSLAVAFSLAGIAAVVRFRNALEDTKDAVYIFVAIAIGLGAGVGALEASAALSGVYNLVEIALWKWNMRRPALADIALGQQPVPEGGSMLEAIKPSDKPPDNPVAEWFPAGDIRPLTNGQGGAQSPPHKREGMLRVHATADPPTRRAIEEVLDSSTKRWTLESDGRGPEGNPILTYLVRLKKRRDPADLLRSLQERLAPELSERGAGGDGSQSPTSG